MIIGIILGLREPLTSVYHNGFWLSSKLIGLMLALDGSEFFMPLPLWASSFYNKTTHPHSCLEYQHLK